MQFICTVVIAWTVLASAQAGFDGKWRTEVGPDEVVIEIKTSGTKATGSVARTAVPNQKPGAFEGTIEKGTLTLTMVSPDGRRTVTLTGRRKGEQIVFAREVKGVGGGPGFYGLQGPTSLIASRVKE